MFVEYEAHYVTTPALFPIAVRRIHRSSLGFLQIPPRGGRSRLVLRSGPSLRQHFRPCRIVDRFNPSNFAGIFQSFGGGSFGNGSGQFDYPVAVAVDKSGNVFVSDLDNNRVVEFNPSNFAGTFTSFNGIRDPRGIAVDQSGNVFVVSDASVVEFNPSNFAGTLTSFGSLAMRTASPWTTQEMCSSTTTLTIASLSFPQSRNQAA